MRFVVKLEGIEYLVIMIVIEPPIVVQPIKDVHSKLKFVQVRKEH